MSRSKPLPEGLHLDTLAVRAAVDKSQYGENSEALYLSSSFTQPDSETSARRFAGEEEGYIYSRFTNPTVASMEKRLAALEGMESCIAAASGMGAILLLCMGLLKAGDHVVCSRSVFGSTIKLLAGEFGKFGVQTSFVSQTDIGEWKAAIRPGTRLLFAETPTNPLTEVCDIRALADLAHEAGALLAVDNCFCTPALQQPVKLGADIVVHSGTKYLDGQGRVIAGALCASQSLVKEKFIPVMRSAGITLSPFNAWVVLKGLETLGIRMEAQSLRALELARWLEAHPKVERVYYPGLASHPQHGLAMAQQSGRGGAVLSFDVKGQGADEGRRNAFRVIDATQLLSITANLGDVKSIITQPASTSHGRLTEQQRLEAGIRQNLIRVAVGLEHLDDLKADLARGLDLL
ncbi:O-succinylhomoserine sulfhydrylase [Ramlibacter tataouinensis]|uniref:O-succinylhomoserine sulfhydrylase n=1 Tax=Ramlibacter tataouinensis (strain ATCC BAA-407 / DSM 14655 / LMG 21543 / TTB310) TaxID=365046 RepID=F5Y0D3_RAMTT|nr:O-succinylhomoserine sulfhydrylase [Ramlibacter tataouinensis]AEG92155.1 cystathionine gamma-synthase (O-succinylhomoserine (Thiol)-lyase)-like protein [Ramlibacter tataouinensis TTB310]